MEEKIVDIERKQDRFFWALLVGCVGIILTLVVAVFNMTLNEKMLEATKAILKATN